MRRHIRLKTASSSLCVFCAHRIAPTPSLVYTARKPGIRIQRRGLRSSAVSPRAAEASAQAQQPNDPFDPFGRPLPNQILNPEEAARATVARLKEQRAAEEQEAARLVSLREQAQARYDDERESASLFGESSASSRAPISADKLNIRNSQLRRRGATERSRPAQQTIEQTVSKQRHELGAARPHEAGNRQEQGQKQAPGDSSSIPDNAGEYMAEVDTKVREAPTREPAQRSGTGIFRTGGMNSNGSRSAKPLAAITQGTPRNQGTTDYRPQANRPQGTQSLAEAMTGGRQRQKQQATVSREQAIADITEKMNMKSMPRLDRDRPQRQATGQGRKAKQSAFPVFAEARSSFPSFASDSRADVTAASGTSEWAHSDLPEVPPEVQARIDEENRPVEERRIQGEKKREEERLAAEAQKAEQERLAAERRKDAERKESERKLREAHRRKMKQEEEARLIAETARWNAQQQAQQQAQATADQFTREAQATSTQSGQSAQSTASDRSHDAGLTISEKETEDMTEEEIELRLRLLAIQRAKRAKTQKDSAAQQTSPRSSTTAAESDVRQSGGERRPGQLAESRIDTNGLSDLMKAGMMASGDSRGAPKNDLSGPTQTSARSYGHHPMGTAQDDASPLKPFDPKLTSGWSIFNRPRRNDNTHLAATSNDSPSAGTWNQPSKSQDFLRLRKGLNTDRTEDPFTPVGRYEGPRKETRTCNLCGQPGHISFFCPTRKASTPHPAITERAEQSRRPQPRFSRSADSSSLANKDSTKNEVRPRDAFDEIMDEQENDTSRAFTIRHVDHQSERTPMIQDRERQTTGAVRSQRGVQQGQETKQARSFPTADEDVQEDEPEKPAKARSARFADPEEEDPEPQITLRSRKFAEPEEDERPQRKAARRRPRDDEDDLDEDSGRRRGGRKSAMRNLDDEDDFAPRHSRRGREDADELDELSGAAKIRDKRQRERDERRAKARKEQERKLAISAKRAQALTKITLPQFITVSNLAQALDVNITPFLRKIDTLGFTVSGHDHVLSAEDASLIALEYGFAPTTGADLEVEERDLRPRPEAEDKSSLPGRPPIVTIMGHVDHGKTTILDYLRKSSVAATEHGGITQHIGAFSVNMSGGKTITFLDTPGHAAFLSMRKRGANVTDIVILVVAADDSVKPQTLEALKHAREAKVPILVAVNKVDKPEADVQRVKNDLARHGVEIEDFGGDVQVVPVSGKTGEGMEDLEEAVVTLGEILDHRAERDGEVEGWVLEATTKAAGRVATVLVRRGTLKTGDVVVAGQTWTKVRTLRNEAGVEVAEAGPGMPVEVDGWRDQPAAGDLVLEADSEQKATDVVDFRVEVSERAKLAEDVEAINEARRLEQERREKEKEEAEAKAAGETAEDGGVERSGSSTHQEVPFIIKADVSGSAEAVVGYLQQLMNPLVSPKILRSAVGPISEFDIDHAAAAKGHIICFNLPQPTDEISGLAQHNKVRVIEQNVIYRLLEQVKGVLEEKLDPVKTQRVIGEAEVLKPFDISIGGRKKLRIAGSRVRNGEIRRNSRVRVTRDGKKIYDGLVTSLKNVKKDVTEMRKGTECGIGFENWIDAQEGDQIQTYEEIEEKRALPI
ncbi:Elongation factor Tu GTP-binding domain-containing protein 1 [Elsinoe fawcettii]|nr:Elongation factor Tu GTP-binding domain-containing protein 1 [Elsinoe fawcettii]